ncbi:MAG TPA: hypothetical protein VGX70_15465, partial [Gemmataceae bacterium]|nr:hypothetical protein [Gemmataceae bacterium]
MTKVRPVWRGRRARCRGTTWPLRIRFLQASRPQEAFLGIACGCHFACQDRRCWGGASAVADESANLRIVRTGGRCAELPQLPGGGSPAGRIVVERSVRPPHHPRFLSRARCNLRR